MEVETITTMLGKTMLSVEGSCGQDSMTFYADTGETWSFFHMQDCCESVQIEDICGDLLNLVGSPILQAEVVSNADFDPPENADSYTWTFYKFATMKGYVTIRWLGKSNGYYSERVSMSYSPRDI